MKSVLALILLLIAGYSSGLTTVPARVDAQESVAAITGQAQPTLQPTSAPRATLNFSYPIGKAGHPLGDGFFVRHGYATENTWYNPGWWHTGEDWYAVEGDTAGARIYAIANGTVVYADANYPGRVVIVQHAPDLFSMYGHLDPKLAVRVGQRVQRGDLLGTVLRRSDKVPNHLHFEVRTFLTTRVVNGSAPRYGYRCGVRCPPGPGYWPMRSPDHPGVLGWRNPMHVIAQRAFSVGASTLGDVVVTARPVSSTLTLWSNPSGATGHRALGTLTLQPGDRFTLLDIRTGPEDSRGTSALAYDLWYRIRLSDGLVGWIQVAVPNTFEQGADKRPSSIFFNLVPALDAT